MTRRRTLPLCWICFSVAASSATARVFSYEDVGAAALLKGSAGSIQIQQGAYGTAMGRSTTFDVQPEYALSGEVGALISQPHGSWLVSVEYLTPKAVQGAIGARNGVGELLKLDSYVYAVIGWLGYEFQFRKRQYSRINFGLFGGYGQAQVVNSVQVAASGVSLYNAGASAYEEHGTGSGFAGRLSLGWEFLFTTNVFMNLELGYRYFLVESLTHTTNVDGVNGAVSKGSVMKNTDGTVRALDLSGAFAGLQFRFYF